MMNLERLRALHAISATGSVVGAAGLLHVTTSAISQQMARLERETGTQLVERQGRGIRLTEAGTLLAGQAGELLAHVEEVEAKLAAHQGAVTGTVTLAAFATAARGLLPSALGDLRARHGDLTVATREREPRQSIPAVRRGLVDVAVVQDWEEDPLALPDGLDRTSLLTDTYDVALHPDHRLAARHSLSLTDLKTEPWIGWPPGELCHDWLLTSLPAALLTHSASEHSTQLALVAAGLGVALIPRLGREPASAPVRFVPLDPSPRRTVFAVWRATSTARPSIGAVIGALERAAGGSTDAM